MRIKSKSLLLGFLSLVIILISSNAGAFVAANQMMCKCKGVNPKGNYQWFGFAKPTAKGCSDYNGQTAFLELISAAPDIYYSESEKNIACDLAIISDASSVLTYNESVNPKVRRVFIGGVQLYPSIVPTPSPSPSPSSSAQ